jgi:hypothetical protein
MGTSRISAIAENKTLILRSISENLEANKRVETGDCFEAP